LRQAQDLLFTKLSSVPRSCGFTPQSPPECSTQILEIPDKDEFEGRQKRKTALPFDGVAVVKNSVFVRTSKISTELLHLVRQYHPPLSIISIFLHDYSAVVKCNTKYSCLPQKGDFLPFKERLGLIDCSVRSWQPSLV
jgi:hypothetical protein